MLNFSLDPSSVVSLSLYVNQYYSDVHVRFKISDDEYLHLSYEWENGPIPEFAIQLLSLVNMVNKESASKSGDYINSDLQAEYENYLSKKENK